MSTVTAPAPNKRIVTDSNLVWKLIQEGARKEFEYLLHTCIIKRAPLGHLCGYVHIPENHVLTTAANEYGHSCKLTRYCEKNGIKGRYDDDEITPASLFSVHGGITWASRGLDKDDDRYFLGFDCAHYKDLSPLSPGYGNIARSFLGDKTSEDGVYRDMAYVEAECRSLVEQIVRFNAGMEPVL